MEGHRTLPEIAPMERYGQRFTPLPKECVTAVTHFDPVQQLCVGINNRNGEHIYRIIKRDEEPIRQLIRNATLVFDVKIAVENAQQTPHSLIFQYENNDHTEPCVAMEFDAIEPDTIFSLRHRFTLPSMRGKGLGTRLYAQAEEFFAELARQTGKDVTLQINTGQEGVMRWAEALGFRIQPQDEETYNEIRNHPELFLKGAYTDPQHGWKQEGYFFRNGVTRIHPRTAVRVTFEKVLPAR